MPTMPVYGGGPNPPVRMDPFQNIVNVHWTDKHLVLIFQAQIHATGGILEASTTIGPPFVPPFTEAYIGSVQLTPPVAEDWIGNVYVGGAGGWAPASSTVEVTGLPDPPLETLDYWAWNAINPPFHQWQNSETEIDPPHIPAPGGGVFSQGLAVNVMILGQQILAGAPYDVPFGIGSFPGKWGTYSLTFTEITTQAFPLLDLSATYKEKTYLPIASIVTGAIGTESGTLQVLMERQPEPEVPPP